ncbi:CLUMA_CG000025, isoform A [Clunio marinus]|uniref:protein disulfide-isomerase n=1 Tax=Clunio marinus TaxID=568069 RepID=A0A1J1HF42_9DIPT|nr:CLUMA_CG000025, isoform A [Clunio marinus]
MLYSKIFGVFLLINFTLALYDSNDDVVQLTSANFDKLVTSSDNVWIVEFFAPWCGHCKNLVPEYKKLARALKGVVKVGSVDCDDHKDLAGKFGVSGFPSIKIFIGKDHSPYNGERTAKAMAEAGLAQVKKKVKAQLEGSSSSNGKSKSSGDDVIELTDFNFDKLVMQSDDVWLVELFAPWCGHCKNLAPEWAKAASELKGKVKLGALDATIHTSIASKYQVQGYPTIKFFPGGKKDSSSVQDYDGGRTASDIVTWANEKYVVNIPAPDVNELISEEVAKSTCESLPLCVVAILPNIYDCKSECRNSFLNILKEMATKYKQKMWGWLWAEAGSQLAVEEALDIGGFGYPALAAVNIKKSKFSLLRGSFSKEGINEFLRDLAYGRGSILPLKGTDLPKIHKLKKWDGKDAEPIVEEDIDLSDVVLDDKDEL